MKKDLAEKRDFTAQPAERKRHAGLANALRPGFGTRTEKNAMTNPQAGAELKTVDSEGEPRATPHGYEEPRPEPREQAPDSFAHEQERSTGVSGHSGNA